jgi:hypothetical protein
MIDCYKKQKRKDNLTWSSTHKTVVSKRIVKDEEESLTRSLLQIEEKKHVTIRDILDTSEQKDRMM